MMEEPSQEDFVEDSVDADGIHTHYWEAGSNDDPSLVLVHGGGSGADAWGNWKYAMGPLAEAGYHVHALDMVGFGKSATPDPDEFEYTNQARIDQVEEFVETLNLDTPSIIGNSMGGAAAMGVAIQSPDLIDNLILVGGAGHLTPEERPKRSQEAIGTLSSFDGSKESMHDVIDVLSVADWYNREAMVEHRLRNLERSGVKAAFSETMRIVRDGDMYYDDEEIASITNETLIINGRDDLVIPPRGAWGLFDLIEPSTVHVLRNCGHWVMIDQVDWSTSLVVDFLRRPL